MKHIIFEGKVVLAGRTVDFRIFEEFDEDGEFMYYSYAINPQLRDKSQAEFHNGETLKAKDLKTLLSRFMGTYRSEFTEIVEERTNPNFY